MKLRLPKGRAARGLIYLICVLLIALAIDLVLVRLARRVTPSERPRRSRRRCCRTGESIT